MEPSKSLPSIPKVAHSPVKQGSKTLSPRDNKLANAVSRVPHKGKGQRSDRIIAPPVRLEGNETSPKAGNVVLPLLVPDLKDFEDQVFSPHAAKFEPPPAGEFERVQEMEKTKVRSMIVKALPFLSSQQAGVVVLLQSAENEILDLYRKKWKVLSEDQLPHWLAMQTLLSLARKVGEAGAWEGLIEPKDRFILEVLAREPTEYISWLLDTLDAITVSQVKGNERLLPKRTKDSENNLSVNGSYIVKTLSSANDAVVSIAIMKPSDEETGAPNCPNLDWREPKKRAFEGIMPGEGPMREHIAYLLGKELGVPHTMSCEGVVCSEFIGDDKRKTVSLQRFVPNSMNFARELTENVQQERLSRVDPENIKRLALLDLRLFNADRGAWNVMITDENQLVPIDHGAVLSADMILDSINFCWLIWPQTHTALSDENRAYIERMDWSRDKQTILTLYPNFPLNSLKTAQFCYELLKAGKNYDLTLYEMGLFYTGDTQKIPPSRLLLEKMKESHDYENHLPVMMDKFIAYYSHMRNFAKSEIEKLCTEIPNHRQSINALFFGHSKFSGTPPQSPLIYRLYRESANAEFANIDSLIINHIEKIRNTLIGVEKLLAAIPEIHVQEALRVHFLEGTRGTVPSLLALASESSNEAEIIGKVQEQINDFMEFNTKLEKEITETSGIQNMEKIKNHMFGKDPRSETPPIIEIMRKNKSAWLALIKREIKRIKIA